MLAFWYLETDLERPDFVLKLDIKQLPEESVSECRTIVAARLNKWCRGFLEVIWSPTAGSSGYMAQLFKVDFLHRIVRDFLMTRNIQDAHIERAGPDFNASLTTCRLYRALANGCTLPFTKMHCYLSTVSSCPLQLPMSSDTMILL